MPPHNRISKSEVYEGGNNYELSAAGLPQACAGMLFREKCRRYTGNAGRVAQKDQPCRRVCT